MRDPTKPLYNGGARETSPRKDPTTPQKRLDAHLAVPVISPIPIPIHRLSPAIDEFSLRRTPSRGGTASPAPAKGVRKRLNQYRKFDHAVNLLKQSKNIVVLTGAGISTSVGIPDFRSDKGLYSQLSKDLGITEAEEFFSRDYFIQNTDQFFQYVKKVIPEAVIGPDGLFRATNPKQSMKDGIAPVPHFSHTHAFLALLHSKRKLLTNYTQNIDGLEIAAGIPRAKFIQCHGSWDTASCMTCNRSSAARKYLPVVFAGNIPFCKCKLETKEKGKQGRKKTTKKRSWDEFDSDHSSDDGTQAPRGLLKPDITFFNERLSGLFGDRLDGDKRKIDLLIIIGTSLKVGPVQDMLYQISPKVPQIFISKERFSGALCNLPGVQVDIELLGECDLIIEELCIRAGWLQDLEALCWEEGQIKIKSVRPHPSLERQDIVTSSSTSLGLDDQMQQSSVEAHRMDETIMSETEKTGKSIGNIQQSSVHEDDGSNVKDLPVSQQPGVHTELVTVTKTVSKSSNVHNESQIMVTETASKVRSNSPVVEVKQKEVRESKVKIELVEGTTHQWRVSRK